MATRAGAMRGRVRKAIEAHKSAAECIGRLEAGAAIFGITRGQFSMIDIVRHVLEEAGPASISVWTWVIANYEVESVEALINSGGVLSARLVVDRSASVNRGEERGDPIGLWRQRFGNDSIRMCVNHAKIARVWNDRFRVLIRGSMNLNNNPRFEQFDLTEGGPDFDLVTEIEDALPVLPATASNADVEAATGISQAADRKGLPMFKGARAWKP
jgi:hypothetical protein